MCHTHLWKGKKNVCARAHARTHTFRQTDSHMHTQGGSTTQAGVYGKEEKPL